MRNGSMIVRKDMGRSGNGPVNVRPSRYSRPERARSARSAPFIGRTTRRARAFSPGTSQRPPLLEEPPQQVPALVGQHASQDLHLMIQAAVDRKSTRLNSSHVETSYAVFCLKKKK